MKEEVLEISKSNIITYPIFKKWCKETKRSGGVLIGSSIKEFLLYLENYLKINNMEFNLSIVFWENEKPEKSLEDLVEDETIDKEEFISDILYDISSKIREGYTSGELFKSTKCNESLNGYWSLSE